MSRESLALKYRPQEFEDVVQQDASIEILQNQISNGTFKQAYLFAGASGCGKTTTARELIAQAQLKPLTGK